MASGENEFDTPDLPTFVGKYHCTIYVEEQITEYIGNLLISNFIVYFVWPGILEICSKFYRLWTVTFVMVVVMVKNGQKKEKSLPIVAPKNF